MSWPAILGWTVGVLAFVGIAGIGFCALIMSGNASSETPDDMDDPTI